MLCFFPWGRILVNSNWIHYPDGRHRHCRAAAGPLYQEQEIGLKTWFGVIGAELLAGYARRIYREMLAQLIFAASQLSAGHRQTRHQGNYHFIRETTIKVLFLRARPLRTFFLVTRPLTPLSGRSTKKLLFLRLLLVVKYEITILYRPIRNTQIY